MPTDTTPEEVERAKRYIESTGFMVREIVKSEWIVSGGPDLFRTVFGPTKEDAESSLLNAVVEVMRSVAPVLFEEAAKVCESIAGDATVDCAAAIRGLK